MRCRPNAVPSPPSHAPEDEDASLPLPPVESSPLGVAASAGPHTAGAGAAAVQAIAVNVERVAAHGHLQVSNNKSKLDMRRRKCEDCQILSANYRLATEVTRRWCAGCGAKRGAVLRHKAAQNSGPTEIEQQKTPVLALGRAVVAPARAVVAQLLQQEQQKQKQQKQKREEEELARQERAVALLETASSYLEADAQKMKGAFSARVHVSRAAVHNGRGRIVAGPRPL